MPIAPKDVTAAVLIIGDEVLSGRTQDRNLAFIAARLGQRGIRLREARVVADDEAAIVDAVNALRARYDHVFTTGGIGPTHDDITSASVAKAFGVPLIRNAEAVARLEAHYPPDWLNSARLRMADTPDGATLIDNPVSKAPGFTIGNVHVLPGVPVIMQAMFDGVAGSLGGGARMLTRTISAYLREGDLAQGLAAVQADHPHTGIGSYPYFRGDRFGVSVVLRDTDAPRLDAAVESVCDAVRAVGGEPRFEDEAEAGEDG